MQHFFYKKLFISRKIVLCYDIDVSAEFRLSSKLSMYRFQLVIMTHRVASATTIAACSAVRPGALFKVPTPSELPWEFGNGLPLFLASTFRVVVVVAVTVKRNLVKREIDLHSQQITFGIR